MASGTYSSFKSELMKKTLDLINDTWKVALINDTWKVALLTSAHSFVATHDFWSDVSANQITGSGYTAGGVALASKTVTTDDTDAEGVWDAADPSWASATITARYAIVYKDTGVAGTSQLALCIDFGADKTSTAAQFLITLDAEGLFNIT
jgi:hypothetical protein